MRNFTCVCGQGLFFENTRCTACGRRLGYDPLRGELLALEPDVAQSAAAETLWRSVDHGVAYRLCRNDLDFQVCNWLVGETDQHFCLSCRLNHIVPWLETGARAPERLERWARLEQAKRRLLFTLLAMGLPVVSKSQVQSEGLAFAFLEDQRSNPGVMEQHVLTGHWQGLITVNLAEADHVEREKMRQGLGESYRTLLGHLRHESGHYFFEQRVVRQGVLAEFRELFGDERQDYDSALASYYAQPMPPPKRPEMISAYAQAHPLEDWAECWAHYLHMMDTLETASDYGLVPGGVIDLRRQPDIEWCLWQWSRVSVAMNALNRSMGLEDAYPFVHSDLTLRKLRYVHQRIYPSSTPMQTGAFV
jgi:hypothetical protein